MQGYTDIAGPLKEVLNLSYEKTNYKNYEGTDITMPCHV